MRKTFGSMVSGLETVATVSVRVATGVGSLSRAVSTTVINLTTEDDDLSEFLQEGDRFPRSNLRGASSGKELSGWRDGGEKSIDSGVVTERSEDHRHHLLRRDHSDLSISSDLTSTSTEDFVRGLDIAGAGLENNGSPIPTTDERRDEITHVTDDILSISSESSNDEFSLGTVDITATDVFLARQRHASTDSAQTTLVFANSGQLRPRRFDTSPRTASTLSPPTTTEEESTQRDRTVRTVSMDTVRGRVAHEDDGSGEEQEDDEFDLEEEDEEGGLVDSIAQFSLQHDPTTIESFESDSSSVADDELALSDHLSDDLVEPKDPFRDSFLATSQTPRLPKTNCPEERVEKSPTSYVRRRDAAKNVVEVTEVSELSVRSQKSCSISRKAPVHLKPIPRGGRKPLSPSDILPKLDIPCTSSSSPRPLITTARPSPDLETTPRGATLLTTTTTTALPRHDQDHTATPRSSATLEGLHSLDRTKSYGTYTPGNFPTESSPSGDVAETGVTTVTTSASASSSSSSSSSFYSFSSEEPPPPAPPTPSNVIVNGKTSKSFMMSMKNSFKRLTSFLSLSRSKEPRKEPKIPVPPPAHTKPEKTAAMARIRQNVKPANTTLNQPGRLGPKAMSCTNLAPSKPLVPSERQELESPQTPDEVVRRKKLSPPVSLVSHITNHYNSPAATPKRRPVSQCNFPTSSLHLASSPNLVTSSSGFTRPGLGGPSVSSKYKSSPCNLLPSPPANRKPGYRETKASRLRLNRVRAPSMTSLQL